MPDLTDLLHLVHLGSAMNVLQPGSISKIAKPFTKDNYNANVNAFLQATQKFGVPADKCFKADDLVEGTNIPAVINTMLTLGRLVRSNQSDPWAQTP